MKKPLVIYWSRRDFRFTDNPALTAALHKSRTENVPFLPLFILEAYMTAGDPKFQFGYPSRYFLSRAVPAFASQFSSFVCVHSKAVSYFTKLSADYVISIFVNEDVYPDFYIQLEKIKNEGIDITVCPDALTVSKDTRTGDGKVYSIFTPFKKAVWTEFVAVTPIKKPSFDGISYLSETEIKKFTDSIEVTEENLLNTFSKRRLLTVEDEIFDLDELVPIPDLSDWYVSEDEAIKKFIHFLHSGLAATYDKNRNSLEGDLKMNGSVQGMTSRMSVALAWGLVSSRMLVSLLKKHFEELFDNPFSNRVEQGALTYISELIWREFYKYLLFHNPELMGTEFQQKFRGTVRWTEHEEAIKRFTLWIKGETGYPVVDAAMHQIAHMGWMHNRARMIVASVLTKNLGVDWRWGQEYFRAALIDLDEASNNGGWQWGASVGADPKPIRIFNPELQAKNYDASGVYRKIWLESENEILRAPTMPIVEHSTAREEALKRYGLKK